MPTVHRLNGPKQSLNFDVLSFLLLSSFGATIFPASDTYLDLIGQNLSHIGVPNVLLIFIDQLINYHNELIANFLRLRPELNICLPRVELTEQKHCSFLALYFGSKVEGRD